MNKQVRTDDASKRRIASRSMASRVPKVARSCQVQPNAKATTSVSEAVSDPNKSDSLSVTTAAENFALLQKARVIVSELESECVRFHLGESPHSLVGYLRTSDLTAERRKFERFALERLETELGTLPQNVFDFIHPLIAQSAERVNVETMKVISAADVRFSRDDVLQFMGFDKKFGHQPRPTSVAERKRMSRLAKQYPLVPVGAAMAEVESLYATLAKEGKKRVRFDWLLWVKRHYGEFVDAGLFDALEVKRLHPLPDGSNAYDRLVKQLDNMKSSLGEHFPEKSAARELRLRYQIAPDGLAALEASVAASQAGKLRRKTK